MKIKDLLTTRRNFLKSSAAAGAILSTPGILTGDLFAAESDKTLRIGLIGCGGRGTGAAEQALRADKNTMLVAMGDVFEDKLHASLTALQRQGAPKEAATPQTPGNGQDPKPPQKPPGREEEPYADRIKVRPGKCFVGLDAYQKVIDSGVDIVLLTTPPGFRPMHLKAAVDAGKHVFCEKPMATDAPGVRSVIESGRAAKAKNLAVMAGFCWRHDFARREFYKRIHEGAIGEIRAIYATYYTGPVKPMPPLSERPPGMGDLEWQLHNWYNFVWLSGDGLVEQACHSIDKIAWAMKDATPLKAVAVGGRNTPNNQGNIYDHMFITYEFENDVRAFMGQRQVANAYSDNSDYLMGELGFGKIPGWSDPFIRAKETWRYRGPKVNMYQQEHDELFASIRKGEPINDTDWMAHSTMMGIMGRMAAYTGQEVTWDEAFNSTEKLVPDELDWKMKLDIRPMAIPGFTKLT